jgi:transposase
MEFAVTAPKRVLGSTADLAALRAQLDALVKTGAHDKVIESLFAILEKQQTEIRELALRYSAALQKMYRKKSEKISADQLALFLAQLPMAEAERAHVEVESLPVVDAPPATEPKRRGGRKPLPEHLRREIIDVPVPAEERVCECGREKSRLRAESQLTLEYKPAELYLIEHRREIVVCKHCQEGVVIAPAAPKPIEGGRPGPGLLAYIVTSKFRDALPLYRQSEILKRSGVDISDSTLGDWCAASADLGEPLWKEARRQTLASYLLSLDDTGMPVLDRDHPSGIKRGHIWTFLGDGGCVGFCEYTPDWKGYRPRKVLADFTGKVIQSDGYAGLDELFTRPDAPRRAGCMDHCRRRFRDALDGGDVRAAVVVSLMRDLYAVEERATVAGASRDDLAFRRRAHSRPIVDRLHQVIAELHKSVVPKSPLGKAVTYAINQWPTLTVFLDDPRVPLSNAHVERQQRRTALGRKNYLFAGSDEGGRRLAILQTLIICCDLVGAPPFAYLRDLFGKLAAGWPHARVAELLPAAWLTNHGEQQPKPDAVTS